MWQKQDQQQKASKDDKKLKTFFSLPFLKPNWRGPSI
jgi:hypothetical protein